MSEYAERDILKQGKHYVRHVAAMTAEGLCSKSDIAAELAHRDIEIDRLRAVEMKAYLLVSGLFDTLKSISVLADLNGISICGRPAPDIVQELLAANNADEAIAILQPNTQAQP